MKTLKLSYSIISQWKMGRFEEAIATYLGKPYPTTDAMELGKLYDEKWNKHIESTGKLPDELGGGDLKNPHVQKKYQARIPFTEDCDILLRGVIDLLDDDMITDNKCGRTEAVNYVDQTQLDYYSLFAPDRKIGRYLCYNPYTGTLTVGIKFLNEKVRERAIEEILTYGGEIYNYLQAHKLFIDYKKEGK